MHMYIGAGMKDRQSQHQVEDELGEDEGPLKTFGHFVSWQISQVESQQRF